jgi:hypothetical protein
MRYQQVVHVVCMLFFLGQNAFQHDARGGIIFSKIADQFAVMLNRYPLGQQVYRSACLRSRTRRRNGMKAHPG